MFSLTVSAPLVVEVSLDCPFWPFQPAYMSVKDFRTKLTTGWLWWLIAGSGFKALCQKQVFFSAFRISWDISKEKKRIKTKCCLKSSITSCTWNTLSLSSWGRQEWGHDCCCLELSHVTWAGKGLSNSVSLGKQMKKLESRGNLFA